MFRVSSLRGGSHASSCLRRLIAAAARWPGAGAAPSRSIPRPSPSRAGGTPRSPRPRGSPGRCRCRDGLDGAQPEGRRARRKAHVEIANAAPGGAHPWHVHRGQCGNDMGVLGPADAYPSLEGGRRRQGDAEADLPIPMPAAGQYSSTSTRRRRTWRRSWPAGTSRRPLPELQRLSAARTGGHGSSPPATRPRACRAPLGRRRSACRPSSSMATS